MVNCGHVPAFVMFGQPILTFRMLVAANLFDNIAKKRFSNVFTKLRVLQMENVDRVLLLDLEGLSRAQIAQVLGLSENAVAICMTRLRQTFETRYLEM